MGSISVLPTQLKRHDVLIGRGIVRYVLTLNFGVLVEWMTTTEPQMIDFYIFPLDMSLLIAE